MRQRPAPSQLPPDSLEPLPAWRVDADGEPHQLLRGVMLRRGFLAGLGALSLGSLAVFLNFFNPRGVTGFGGLVDIPASLVPKPGQDPVHFLEGRVWLVNLRPGDGVPEAFRSVAPPSAQGGLLALYHVCPHLGCTVPWRSDFEFGGVTGWFRCPCHGSTYTKGGIRVFGPAQRSMDTLQIKAVTSGGVTIDTSRITRGSLNDPQRASGRAVPAGPFA